MPKNTMPFTTIGELAKIRDAHKDAKIVFCSGSFDLPHAGHILFFEDCRKHGDLLVVGVGSDAIIKKNKGDERPILNEHVRLKTISSFKTVDYCFLDNSPYEAYSLTFIEDVFKTLKPQVYVINEDAFDIPYRQELSRKYGVELIILNRWAPKEFEEISTTKIIKKIKDLALEKKVKET